MHEISNDDAVERIALGVSDCTLPKSEWTHAAHVAAALWLLQHGEAGAMPALIRAYNEATGVANTDAEGYHHTITMASLRAAADALRRAPADTPLADILRTMLAAEFGRSQWLLAYWSRALLFSVAARRAWIAPDLCALPYQPLEWE